MLKKTTEHANGTAEGAEQSFWARIGEFGLRGWLTRDGLKGDGAAASGLPGSPSSWPRTGVRLGLPGKLLVLTAIFVLIAEILIFLPSLANFRINWLNERMTAAEVSALAADAVPARSVPPQLRSELLRTALVRAIAIRRGGARRLVLPPVQEISIDVSYDLRTPPRMSMTDEFWLRLSQIGEAIDVMTASEERTMRIVGLLGPRYDDVIEVVMPEEPLRRAMWRYGVNIFWLSSFVALVTAAFVYFAISTLLVKPMLRISRNMVSYGENPEDLSRVIEPSGRADEIGDAEAELARMQRQLSQLLMQKNRLAQLGLAVSKINHDLRNMLANAQLLSDRLTAIDDPQVQRFAPKLIASLDRAIAFCNDTLRFGRAEEAAPRRERFKLAPLLVEVGDGLGLGPDTPIAWKIDAPATLEIDADREHLLRILSNLGRNAVQAIETKNAEKPEAERRGEIALKAWRQGPAVTIRVKDDGPGIPEAVRTKLFQAFQGSTKRGGAGLGLAIAAELAQAHGGSLRLADVARGTAFELQIPDRPKA
ncbi:MAG: HAMP domain-containing sensor histidine kinase [Hyphomicrobium sp.]|nr:HAMP domain-containing sensor histidine kinase [Hyphomicrobium sp.]